MHPQDASFPEPQRRAAADNGEPAAVAGRIDSAVPMSVDASPAGLSAGPDLKSLLLGLKRRWLLAATLGGFLAVLAAGSCWLLLTPDYTAFAQMRISFIEPSLTDVKNPDRLSFSTYIRSQASLLRSRPVIQAALRKEEVKRLGLDRHASDPAQYVEKRLAVDFQDGSEFLTVSFRSPDPQQAVAVLKAITESYMDYIDYGEKNSRTQRITELERVYNETSANLKTKKANLRRLAATLGTLDKELLSRQREEILIGLRTLEAQRLPLQRERDRAVIGLKVLEAQGPVAPAPSQIDAAQVETALQSDPIARPYLARLMRAQATVRDYDVNAVEPLREPLRRKAAREAAEMEALLATRREEVKKELASKQQVSGTSEYQVAKTTLRTTITTLDDQLKGLDDQVAQIKESLSRHQGASSDTELLQGDIVREEELLNQLGVQLKTMEVNRRAPDRITLHQEAELQNKDARKQMLATIAAPVFVFGGVCLVIAYGDCRQRRVHSARELVSGLGLRVVGSVPRMPHLEQHLLDANGDAALEGHPVLESIDAIRTMLLHEAQAEATRTVMVTSAGHGEGKTTLAGHLASSLARAGRKTLLIDGDLRRPAAHQLFELPMQPGFSEVLLAEVEASDAIQPTPQENLFVMAAGQWDREVLQALARDGLEGIFEKLRTEFDFIIVDSHPVLAATDALLLGQRVDAVLLSVLRGTSQTPRIYAAALRLTALNIRVLGAVVNGSDPEEVLTGAAPHPVSMAV